MNISLKPHSLIQAMSLDQALALVDNCIAQFHRDEARHVLEQLVDQLPKSPRPSLRLLNFYLEEAEIEKGLALAEQASKTFRKNEDLILVCAQVYERAEQTEQAMRLLDRGIKLCKSRAPLMCSKGAILITQGENAAATDMFERALASSNHTDPAAYFNLARSADEATLRKHQNRIDKLLGSRTGSPQVRGLLHFAKAYFYEKQDAERYFHHLHEGNAAFAEDHIPYFANEKKIFSNVKAGYVEQLLGSASRELEAAEGGPIFIAALPRSGTSLLEKMLGAHDAIYPVGESMAFNNARVRTNLALNTPSAINWSLEAGKPLDTYLSTLRKNFESHPLIRPAGTLRIVDKSIENLRQVGMILLAYPQARIIHLKRHPLDTILSCYHQCFEGGFSYLFNLEALAQYYQLNNDYLELWRTLFPDRIFTQEYESLVTEPEKSLRKLLSYCDLDWQADLLDFQNKAGRVRTASDVQLRQPLNSRSVGKWQQYRDQLQPAIRLLSIDGDCV